MNKKKSNKFYKVNLYHVLGASYSQIDSYCCDVESLGEIIVSVSKKSGNRQRVGECKEVMEDFHIPMVECSTSTRYDSWYDEHVREFYLPYEYNYWNKHKNYVVLASEVNDANLVTEEEMKAYDPQRKIWYRYLREIQEKGINFDYEKAAIDELRKQKLLSRGNEYESVGRS